MAWRALFGDADRLARNGFVVSPRLAMMIGLKILPQASAPDMAAYFSKPDGTRMGAGDVLKNPAYAETLRTLAAQGVDGFYKGRIAADIAARTHGDPTPGTLTAADIAGYRPHAAPALCRRQIFLPDLLLDKSSSDEPVERQQLRHIFLAFDAGSDLLALRIRRVVATG